MDNVYLIYENTVVTHFASFKKVMAFYQEKFEDTKEVIRFRKSKKDKQYNGYE